MWLTSAFLFFLPFFLWSFSVWVFGLPRIGILEFIQHMRYARGEEVWDTITLVLWFFYLCWDWDRQWKRVPRSRLLIGSGLIISHDYVPFLRERRGIFWEGDILRKQQQRKIKGERKKISASEEEAKEKQPNGKQNVSLVLDESSMILLLTNIFSSLEVSWDIETEAKWREHGRQ